ncbi:MAG TPA: prenyltransferase [Thiobacillaceae bacterium]|nr:prenyltransferase [Thiobacillaceae bacterium]
MPPLREPTPERLTNPVVRWLLATRPAFLTMTLVGCLLGFATAIADGVGFNAIRIGATMLLALLAHAAINVLNDYCDHLNGTDARNVERLYPYTGGSRFIQNGVLTPAQMRALAVALFAATIAGGLWLLAAAGHGLFWIGLGGLFIGWAYSAPPLALNSRGAGEVSVAAGFLLVVAGADYVQRGAFAATPWLAGLAYAWLVANVLYINQFPDREADRASGKLHWVARLPPATAARGYGVMLLLAALGLAVAVGFDALPPRAAVAYVVWVPALVAWRQLHRFAATPGRLVPAIRLTLLAAHLLPLLLAAALLLPASR